MAVPEVRAVGAKAQGKTTETEVGAPAGIETGDLEILIASTEVGGTMTIPTAGGSAWSAMGETPIDVTLGEKLYVWTRVRQVGDGNPKVKAATNHFCAGRIAIKKGTFDSETPTEIAKAGSETTSDTSFVFKPEKETAGADRLCFVVCSSNVDSETGQAGTNTANSSLTSIVLDCEYQTKEEGGGGFWCAHGTRAAKGTVGEWTQTMTAASPKAYVSFAVRPVPAKTVEGIAIVEGSGSLTAKSTRETLGKATVEGTSAFAPKGTRVFEGKATVAGSGAVAPAGTRIATGKASVAGIGSVSPSGQRTATSKASIPGTGAIAASSSRIATGKGTVEGSGTVSAKGTRTTEGIASVSGSGALAAKGLRIATGQTVVAGQGTVASDGLRIATGKATINGLGSIIAVPGGAKTVEGVATISGSGELQAAGTRIVLSSAAITSTGTVVATGLRVVPGKATITGLGTVTAIGVAEGVELEALATLTDSAINVRLTDRATTEAILSEL